MSCRFYATVVIFAALARAGEQGPMPILRRLRESLHPVFHTQKHDDSVTTHTEAHTRGSPLLDVWHQRGIFSRGSVATTQSPQLIRGFHLHVPISPLPANHHQKVRDAGKESSHVAICDLCPIPEEILPCTCSCLTATSAELTCGPDLLTCNELTDILTMASFPASHYSRLHVSGTALGCQLRERLWGNALTFTELHLPNNQFEMVDNHAFKPFRDFLTILQLDSNSLCKVYFPTMNNLPLLQQLMLDDNQITFLHGSSSLVLPKLKLFRMARNQMANFQGNTFAELPALEEVDLSQNQIPYLPCDAINIVNHSAPRLLANFSHNAITELCPDAFRGVPTTADVIVDLRYNQLKTLPEVSFTHVLTTTSSRILLSGNPLECDVRLCWLLGNIEYIHLFDNFFCPNIQAYLYDLDATTLGCSRSIDAETEA